MGYRPHFAYPTPPGFVDELADFPFDYRQADPAQAGISAQGSYNLTLALDSDAPFIWQGILWEFGDDAWLFDPGAFLSGNICARIKDPFGNYLSDNWVPLLILGLPYYTAQPWTGVNAATPPNGPFLAAPLSMGVGVPLVDEIFCPPSSALTIDLIILNPAYNLNPTSPGRMLARGVKRRKRADCPEYDK